MSSVTAIKLYGERNTGTNYVSQLLALNFSLPQLSGVAPRPDLLVRTAKLLRKGGQTRLANWLLRNSADSYFERNFDQTLGWKHARVPVDEVCRRAPEGLGVIALIKNPYSFILSLYRRPYHGQKQDSMEAFVRVPYQPQKRELLNGKAVTPAELWNEKVNSYCALQQKMPTTQIFRYEDFLDDEFGVLETLAEAWQLPRPDAWKGIHRSTKDADRDREYYRDYYLGEKWRSKLTGPCLDVINSQLERGLLERFGYSRIERANAA